MVFAITSKYKNKKKHDLVVFLSNLFLFIILMKFVADRIISVKLYMSSWGFVVND